MERLLPWHISLSKDGKFVAVLQEGCLEIRTSRDDFTSIIGRASGIINLCVALLI